ncbi:MAG TPA: carbamate kinase [Clostridia bacterium]|nr:carbamate kinase [Clostridia bacterium]
MNCTIFRFSFLEGKQVVNRYFNKTNNKNGPVAIIAIGGNGILREGQRGTVEEQLANIEIVCASIIELIEEGFRVVLTHGNGPQVGNILLRSENSASILPVEPLDVCGAQSQGMLGYLIQKTLCNQICAKGLGIDVATVVTQVIVDENDPAFHRPTKPVGPFYTKEEADKMARERNITLVEDSGRGYRRVVPSPKPVDVVEKAVINMLVENNVLTIALGGGGIPVVKAPNGKLKGVEAVIDKDLAAGLIAKQIKTDYLIILTGVEKVAINFGKPNQQDLTYLSPEKAKEYMEKGYFPPGSMGPKIEAAVSFVEEGGKRAIISRIDKLKEAVLGQTGTIICRRYEHNENIESNLLLEQA